MAMPAARWSFVFIWAVVAPRDAAASATCATVDTSSVNEDATGGRFTFAAHMPNWYTGARVRVHPALQHTDGEKIADCNADCASDEDEMETTCSFCRCAACPLCSLGSANSHIGDGCKVPGQVVACSNARVVQHEAYGAVVLHLGSPTLAPDHKFSCTVSAPAGAKHSAPGIECVDPQPSPPSMAPPPSSHPPPTTLSSSTPPPPMSDPSGALPKPSDRMSCGSNVHVKANVLDASAKLVALHVLGLPAAHGAFVDLQWPASSTSRSIRTLWGATQTPVAASDTSPSTSLGLKVTGTARTFVGLLVSGNLEVPTASCTLPIGTAVADSQGPPGPSCDAVRRSGSDLRQAGAPPLWCHELQPPADSGVVAVKAFCERHYYQLEPDWMVRCTASGAGCEASENVLACQSASSDPPPGPPAWIHFSDECSHLLGVPEVEALTSASFRIRPASSGGSSSPRCEVGLELRIEYRHGSGTWHPVGAHKLPSSEPRAGWHVDNLRCGSTSDTQCSFRVRPEGWGESSKPSPTVAGRALPMREGRAARLEATLHLGASNPACVTCETGRTKFAADVATVLRLSSSALVRVVETREWEGRAAIVFDVLPTSTRTSDKLATQLASLLPQQRSELYGGEMTQYIAGAADGLTRISDDGVARHIATIGTGALSIHEIQGSSPSASRFLGLFVVLVVLVAVLAAYVKGVTTDDVVEHAHTLYQQGQARLLAGSGGRHMKLPTDEMVNFAPAVELTIPDETVLEECSDPSEHFPSSMPRLASRLETLASSPKGGSTPDITSPEFAAPLRRMDVGAEQSGADGDEALLRARRLIDALGSTSTDTPAVQPESSPRAKDVSSTSFAENLVIEASETVAAEQGATEDGEVLLRL